MVGKGGVEESKDLHQIKLKGDPWGSDPHNQTSTPAPTRTFAPTEHHPTPQERSRRRSEEDQCGPTRPKIPTLESTFFLASSANRQPPVEGARALREPARGQATRAQLPLTFF